MKGRAIYYMIILAGIAAVSGCYYDKADQVYPQPSACDTTNIRYSVEVSAILSANCYTCHGGTASAGGGNQLEGYNNLLGYVYNGRLEKAITHAPGASPMPKNMPKLPDCSINKILAWIRQGAPNN